MELKNYLKSHKYPGRLILVGSNEKNERVLAYAIMGRSINSQNRIFTLEDKMLKTKAFDEKKVKDPCLIIYTAKRDCKNYTILANGDQSDTIYDSLINNHDLQEALNKRIYEPDGPIFTSRISALYNNNDNSYSLSIIKKNNDKVDRIIYKYENKPSFVHVIHTYEDDLSPFKTAPLCFTVKNTIEEISSLLWTNLNEDNKISLYVCVGDKEIIINKNEDNNE